MLSSFVTAPFRVPSRQGSLALGALTQLVLHVDAGKVAEVAVHPSLIAGWCVLTTTAFNLLPVGALDGGRMVQAAYGRRSLGLTGLFTYIGAPRPVRCAERLCTERPWLWGGHGPSSKPTFYSAGGQYYYYLLRGCVVLWWSQFLALIRMFTRNVQGWIVVRHAKLFFASDSCHFSWLRGTQTACVAIRGTSSLATHSDLVCDQRKLERVNPLIQESVFIHIVYNADAADDFASLVWVVPRVLPQFSGDSKLTIV